MIEVKNLIKKYGGMAVLDIPDLTIQKGESFGLVGNNGAGKTTLFSLILDLRRATTGSDFIVLNMAFNRIWEEGSRLEKGSSNTRTSGFDKRDPAIPTFF